MEVTRDQLVQELELLRRNSPVTESTLERFAPLIVRHLGKHKTRAALDRLQYLEVKDADTRFIDAALIALGFGPYSGNIDQRWASFIDQFDLRTGSQRTARRWCDTGFRLIADFILKEEGLTEPGVGVTVVQRDAGSHFFHVYMEAAGRYDGDIIYDVWFEIGGEKSVHVVNLNEEPIFNLESPDFTLDQRAELAITWPDHLRPAIIVFPPKVSCDCGVYQVGSSLEVTVQGN